MDLNLLRQFVAVAQAPNFSTAAQALGVRRSSVSRGIGALERALGVQLFSRTTRQVALTTAGRALYAKAAPQLAALDEALGALPERTELPSGELRLTASTDVGATVLPPLRAGFALRYPAVQVDARLTNRVLDVVSEGIDVALRTSAGRLSSSSLVARRLSAAEVQIFAAPDYLARAGAPRTPADTADHEWVAFGRRRIPGFPAPKSPPRVRGDDMLFIRQAVRAGLGLGVLPTFAAREDVDAGRLVRVLPRVSIGGGALYLVYPPSRHVPGKVKAFRDFAVEYFARNPLA